MKWFFRFAFGLLASSVVLPAQDLRLEPLTSFGPNGDGTLRPGDLPFLTAANHLERGMAYNPATGHLLVVTRDSFNAGIYILDATNGAQVGTLNYQGARPGGNGMFPINLIGAAEDGVIYVGNLSNTQLPAEYRLYRWENEAASQTDAYAGDPSNGNPSAANQRWGDTMTVRGSGTNTQILLASRGTQASLLVPIDSTATTFTSIVLNADVPVGALGYGLAFGAGNTFYGTAGASSGGPLFLLGFDPTAGTATTLQRYSSTVFPGNISPITVNPSSNWLAGITMAPGPDVVRLYNISNSAAPPLFLDRESFVTENNNTVFAGALAFANTNLYVLDAVNGIRAFSIVHSAAPIPPDIFLQPLSRDSLVGSNVTFTAAADGTPPLRYLWTSNETNLLSASSGPSLTLTNVQLADAGSYSVVVTNEFGTATSSNAVLTVREPAISTFRIYEPFDYDPDTPLAGQGNWVLNSGTTATAEAGTLEVPGLEPSSGNRIFWRNTGSMSVRLPLGTNIDRGTIYYSFALRVDEVGSSFTAAGVLAGFTTGTTTSFGTKVDIRTNGAGGFNLGTSKAGAATLRWATNDFATDQLIFLVGRYTFNPATGDDVADLWINPNPAEFGRAEPASSPSLTTTGGTDLAQIDRFFFRAGGTTSTPEKLIADELRIGLGWADVTPPLSLPTPPSLLIFRTNSQVTIIWPAAATGFSLEGTPSLGSPVWLPVSESPAVEGTNNVVMVGVTSGSHFFRLRN